MKQLKEGNLDKDKTIWMYWSLVALFLPISFFSVFTLIFGGAASASWVVSISSSWDVLPLRNLLLIALLGTMSYYLLFLLSLLPAANKVRNLFLSGSGMRLPTEKEKKLFYNVLDIVIRDANLKIDRNWNLLISKQPHINMMAGVGGTFVATESSLTRQTPFQMKGIIAHELGHQILGHTAPGFAAYYLSLPVKKMQKVLYFLGHISCNIVDGVRRLAVMLAGFSRSMPAMNMVMTVLHFALLAVVSLISFTTRALVWVFGGILKCLTLPLMYLRRQAEFAADKAATQMSFGNPLMEGILHIEKISAPTARNKKKDRWNDHPPIEKRIQRIEEAMARLAA